MNLHIMNDEKVISRTISLFEESLPGLNKYIILCEKKECKHVKVSHQNVYYANYNTSDFWKYVGDVNNYKYIILHYLSFSAADFVNKVNHQGFVWIIWGADLYLNLLNVRGRKLYDEPFKELMASLKSNMLRTIRDRVRRICKYKKQVDAIRKIQFVAGVDTEILKKYYPDLDFKIIPFYYYPIDDIVGDISSKKMKLGDNIVLGNSASYSNNHKNILLSLSRMCIYDRKIITPLSYGAAKNYIIRIGEKYCFSSFYPITNFMPINEYNKLLFSARTFIYGHHRQEAFGNILTALYIGGAVFLYGDNPLYDYLRNQGFILFNINELNNKIDYQLTASEKKNNYNQCIDLYGKDRLLRLIREGFN